MTSETLQLHDFGSLAAILGLAVVLAQVRLLDRLGAGTRNALLSAGAGASLAYVLLNILPKLAEKQESLMASADTGLRGFLEHHAYLVAMAGLVLYYGMSRVAALGAEGSDPDARSRYRAALVATIVGYSAYSMLVGYLIVMRLNFGLLSLTLITFGMGALFLVTGHGLRKTWTATYDAWIRWVLCAALLAGWAVGVWVDVSSNVVALWYAFLAGLMLITTIGEKLSIEDNRSFWPFLAGVLVFTTALLILEQMAPVKPG